MTLVRETFCLIVHVFLSNDGAVDGAMRMNTTINAPQCMTKYPLALLLRGSMHQNNNVKSKQDVRNSEMYT